MQLSIPPTDLGIDFGPWTPKYNYWWQIVAYFVENLGTQGPINSDDWFISDLGEAEEGSLGLFIAITFSFH